jgi:hypothetical protein
MRAKAETVLCRAMINAINASGRACVWRQQSGRVAVKRGWMHLAPEGSSDIVGYLLDGSGRHVSIEVKDLSTGHGKRGASAEQTSLLAEVAAAGAVAGVATSVDEALAIVGFCAQSRAIAGCRCRLCAGPAEP